MAEEVTIVVKAQDSFSGTLGNFGSIITGIESAINLLGRAFSTFTGLATQGLEAIESYERLSASLDTLVAKEALMTGGAINMAQALKITGDEAEILLDWVQQLAIKSPFTQEGVAQAFQMALAYGFNVEEAKKLTSALLDFAAGSGASEATMTSIARALGQMSATAKVTGGDMLQLANAGLPIVEILAQGFNVTTAELMDLRSKGLLPAQEAIGYVVEYLETNFAGAGARMTETWAGLRGTFEDLKSMGLREFFGGLFEAIRPLAVELSNFLQEEGIQKLSELGDTLGQYVAIIVEGVTALVGDGKLYELGFLLQRLDGTDSIFFSLGTAIRIFQQGVDDGLPSFDALKDAMEHFARLEGIEIDTTSILSMADSVIANFIEGLTDKVNAWIASDGPGELSDKFITWISMIGTGPEFHSNALIAVRNLVDALGDALRNFDWAGVLEAIDYKITELVGRVDWDAAGTEWGEKFVDAISTNVPVPGSSAGGAAIVNAIKNFVVGFFNVLEVEGTNGVRDFFNDWEVSWTNAVRDFFDGIETSITDGFRQALNPQGFDLTVWVRENIIEPIKRVLGISSPSSVFRDIGINIISGLLSGLSASWASVVSWFETKFTNLLENLTWENILSIIQGDMSLSDLFGSTQTGGVGGRIGGGSFPTDTTTGGLSGNTVTNNFYGPVYFGDLAQLGYETCPSPHPLLAASSSTLLTSSTE